ncbi:MAG TPA: hypothetical protein PK400_05085 [Phycisphaerales bacterium]|nr:hypothetical protein [Phycisphaerales bacterium]HRQ75927.1 hypothetical protein [Phycisphaerales bacterium]
MLKNIIGIALLGLCMMTTVMPDTVLGQVSTHCFRLQSNGTCGLSATGPNLYCGPGQSGPEWLIMAARVNMCGHAVATGRDICEEEETMVSPRRCNYACDELGQYYLTGCENLTEFACPSAKLSGVSCVAN